jgi:hypothetical protein
MLGATPILLGMMRAVGVAPLSLVAAGALGGGATYARASAANGFGASGVLFAAAANAPRFVGADAQLLLERQASNLLANPRFEGATPGVIGSGGAVPSDMDMTATSGMQREIVGTGTEDGIPYLDVRWNGTQANTNIALLWFGMGGGWTVGVGTVFALSCCVRLVGGSLANVTAIRFRVQERQNTSVLANSNKAAFTPGTATLRTQRVTETHMMASASVNNARLQLSLSPSANQPVDLTLRIGLPQVEAGGATTSPVLPPAGTPGVSTRAAASLVYAPGGGLPAAGTLLLDGLLAATPAAERRLVAIETADGSAGVAITANAGGTTLSAVPFPSGSAVAGGTVAPGARFRAAIAWSAAGLSISVNGGAAAPGAAPPAGLARVAHGGAAAPEALEIRRLDLIAERLSDGALASLTTLS